MAVSTAQKVRRSDVVGPGLTVMAVRLMRTLFYATRPDYGADAAGLLCGPGRRAAE
jgi:hypothetical protein